KHLKGDLAKYVRFIGKIKVKGKEFPVSIYELFNGDPSDISDLKLKTKEDFERAVRLRDSHDFDAAQLGFKRVLSDFPGDKTTQIYLSRFRKSEK
ncbi:hypothetical protein, partial [Oceanispirochaeta sp.]|uniref:hypothetical protein n=1 Tax=Oceanispirochaeta sp. TaxID=2035350 RepID=UPI0026283954